MCYVHDNALYTQSLQYRQGYSASSLLHSKLCHAVCQLQNDSRTADVSPLAERMKRLQHLRCYWGEEYDRQDRRLVLKRQCPDNVREPALPADQEKRRWQTRAATGKLRKDCTNPQINDQYCTGYTFVERSLSEQDQARCCSAITRRFIANCVRRAVHSPCWNSSSFHGTAP